MMYKLRWFKNGLEHLQDTVWPAKSWKAFLQWTWRNGGISNRHTMTRDGLLALPHSSHLPIIQQPHGQWSQKSNNPLRNRGFWGLFHMGSTAAAPRNDWSIDWSRLKLPEKIKTKLFDKNKKKKKKKKKKQPQQPQQPQARNKTEMCNTLVSRIPRHQRSTLAAVAPTIEPTEDRASSGRTSSCYDHDFVLKLMTWGIPRNLHLWLIVTKHGLLDPSSVISLPVSHWRIQLPRHSYWHPMLGEKCRKSSGSASLNS